MNKRNAMMLLIGVALWVAMAVPAQATAPSSINYQGILTDTNGTPQVGTYSVEFNLYGFAFGGGSIWDETQSVTTDSTGRFNVALGAVNPLDASNFSIGERYLGITVEAEAEMVPRQKIHSVPYALNIATVNNASGGQINGNVTLLGNLLSNGEIDASGMSSKIRFHYNALGDLPDPSTYHGAIAHVHNEGKLYYAHSGAWVPLANESDLGAISVLTSPDGTPDSAVFLDNDGNVIFCGALLGKDSALIIGDSGLVINGGTTFNSTTTINGVMNIFNNVIIQGGNLQIVGPRVIIIQNGAALRVQNGAELEVEGGGSAYYRTASTLQIDPGVTWTSSSRLVTEAEVEVKDPGYVHVHDGTNSVMSDLRYDRLDMDDGLSTMELRTTDLTHTGPQFDINTPKLVVTSPVPVEMQALSLTTAPGLSVTGGGDVSVAGGGLLTTDPASQMIINGPSTFNQPINAPVQVGVGPPGAGALHVVGNITATGAKLFVQDHPSDPSKEIRYIALEAGEAGTYTRGSGQLVNGNATINLPEHFALVTNAEGLTAQITPRARVHAMLYVESVTPTQIVVKSSHHSDDNVPFDFMINGVRLGFENHQVIQDRESLTRR